MRPTSQRNVGQFNIPKYYFNLPVTSIAYTLENRQALPKNLKEVLKDIRAINPHIKLFVLPWSPVCAFDSDDIAADTVYSPRK